MGNKFKEIDIKNRTYYFFNDIINIKNFDLNNITTDEELLKKYSYLLNWTFDNQRLKIRKN